MYFWRSDCPATCTIFYFENMKLLFEPYVEPSVDLMRFLFSDGNQGSGGSRKRSRKKSEGEETTWDSDSEV